MPNRSAKKAEQLHRACRSQWTPIAGCGDVVCMPISIDAAQEVRLEEFLKGAYDAPVVPAQLEMPSLMAEVDPEGVVGEAFPWDMCVVCGMSPPAVEKLLRCGGCRARYCSLEHQRVAWKSLGHRTSCGQRRPTPEIVAVAPPSVIVPLLREYGANKELVVACFARCAGFFAGTSPDLAKEFAALHGEAIVSEVLRAHADSPAVAEASGLLTSRLEQPTTFGALTDEQLLACLARLPRYWQPVLQGVCQRWRVLVRNEGFVNARRACPLTGRSNLEPFVLTVGGSYASNTKLSDYNHGRVSVLFDDGFGRKKWVLAQPVPTVTTNGTLIGLDDEIYLLGGKHEYISAWGIGAMASKPCACVLVFSPRNNSWRAIPPMREARYYPIACASHGRLYVFGGLKFCEDEIWSCESFSPATNRWTSLPPMPIATHGGTAVPIGREIYLIGGAAMPWPSPLDFIQVYNTERREWRVLKTLLPNRDCFGLGFGTKILCFGGKKSCHPEDAAGLHSLHKRVTQYMLGDANAGANKKKAGKGKAAPWLPHNPLLDNLRDEIGGFQGSGGSRIDADGDPVAEPEQDDPTCAPMGLGRVDGLTKEVWSYDTETQEWTQLASSPKLTYPSGGYFYLDRHVVRAAEDSALNYNLATNRWENDPGRKPMLHHEKGANPASVMLPF